MIERRLIFAERAMCVLVILFDHKSVQKYKRVGIESIEVKSRIDLVLVKEVMQYMNLVMELEMWIIILDYASSGMDRGKKVGNGKNYEWKVVNGSIRKMWNHC